MYNLVKKNNIKILVSLISLMILFLGLTFLVRKGTNTLSERQRRLMNYNQVQPGDENVTGTDDIKFDAFFLEDLDNDGNAESIRGNSLEIGDKGELYLELKVTGDVRLTNGKIKFVNSNSRVAGTISKGSLVSSTQSNTNFNTISLKELNNGTSTLTKLTVNANLTNDLNSYTGINKVILTGTVTDLYGNVITDIEKEVSYTVDWYGDKLNARISGSASAKSNGQQYAIVDGEVTYAIESQETEGQLFLKQAYLEAYIAPLKDSVNTYEPDSVVVQGQNVEYDYDPTTHKLTATRRAVLDDTLITTQAYSYKNELISYNNWVVIVKYNNIDNHSSFTTNLSATTWYDAFNNQEIGYDNIKTSNKATKVFTATLSTDWIIAHNDPVSDFKSDTVTVGKKSTTLNKQYVDKTDVLSIYNGTAIENSKTDYDVEWDMNIPTEVIKNNDGGNAYTYELYDDGGDKLGNEISIKDYTTYKTIRFNNADLNLNTTGYIVLINADTDETIHVLTSLDWNNPYTFDDEVRSIKIVVNGLKAGNKTRRFVVNFTKTIDNNKIASGINYDTFVAYSTITSRVISSFYKDNLPVQITNWYSYHNTNQSSTYGSASYLEASSIVYINANKFQIYTTEETDVTFTIKTNPIDDISKGFKNGEFYVVFPSEILDVKLNDVIIDVTDVNLELSETGKLDDGRRYIKIATNNTEEKSLTIRLETTIVPSPFNMGSTGNIELYGYNPNCHNYVNKTPDIYDINDNNDTTEKVGYANTSINLAAPNEIITTSVLKEYNNQNNTTVAPMIAEVNPIDDDPEATVEIGITNNSGLIAKNVKIIGKVAYDDNTYQIGNGSLGSKYDVHMTDDGIKIPAELDGYVTIYYSEQETPTDDLNDNSNGWKSKENTDFTKTKTYMIVFNNHDMGVGDSYSFEYDIEMPITTQNLNKVTYFTHGVYYDLVTSAGLYYSEVGGSKLGIRMSRQYDVELTNLKAYSSQVITGTKYLLEDEDGNQKTLVTNANGKITIKDLYIGKEYTLKQISINSPYVIDEEVKTFKLINGANDEVTLENNGTLKSITLASDKKLEIVQENETRYNLILTDKDFDTDDIITGAKFKITGKGYESGLSLRTDYNGQLSLENLYLNETYEIEQLNVNNYLLTNKFTVRLMRDSNNEVKIAITKVAQFGDLVNTSNNYYKSNDSDGKIYYYPNSYNNRWYQAYIPIDMTELTGTYKLVVPYKYYSSYSNNQFSMFLSNVMGDYSNEFLYVSYDTSDSSLLRTAETTEYYDANNWQMKNLVGGQVYYLFFSAYSYRYLYNYLKIYEPELVQVNGEKYEYQASTSDQDVETFENVNATQSLIDNNVDTPILNVTVKNRAIPTYTLVLNKVDAETNEPLSGAQYKITGPGLPESGKYLTTDENGKASIKLNLKYKPRYSNSPWTINGNKYDYESEYTIVEVAPPVGYTLDRKSVTFEGTLNIDAEYVYNNVVYDYPVDISTQHDYSMSTTPITEGQFKETHWDEDTKTFSVVFGDYPVVKLVKKDAETNELLPNTLFAIYSVAQVNNQEVLTPATDLDGNILGNKIVLDGKEYYVVETDQDGKINFNLLSGKYKVIEVQAADEKYELSDQSYYFGVGETVPYHKKPAKIVDFISINNMDLTSYGERSDYYTSTKDGGLIVTTRDKHLIKYDSDLNIEWNVLLDFKGYSSLYDYYYNDVLIYEYNYLNSCGSGGYRIREAADGSFYISCGGSPFGFAKYAADGTKLWDNENPNYGIHYKMLEISNIADVMNSEGKVPLRYVNPDGTDSWIDYYSLDELRDRGSYYFIDDDTYYSAYTEEYKYMELNSSGVGVDMVPTADGGVFILPYRASFYNEYTYKLKLADGSLVDFATKYPILKFNSEGKITNYYDLGAIVAEADAAYRAKYNLTGSIDLYDIFEYEWGHRYVNTYPNGDIFLLLGYSNRIALKLRYNEQEDKFETIFYVPVGVNGTGINYYVGETGGLESNVQLKDDGGFTLQNGGYTYLSDYNSNSYYNTELQQIDTKYARLQDGGGSNCSFIIEFDGTGKISNFVMTSQNDTTPSQNPAQIYGYDALKLFYGGARTSFYREPNNNFISGKQYSVQPFDYVMLRSGELKNLTENMPTGNSTYQISEFNKNGGIEWVNRYIGFTTGDNNLIIPIGDGSKILVAGIATGDITEVETGITIPVSANGPGFMVLELYDEVTPSGPEAYTLNIDNNRKEYKITSTSNLGGEVVVTNPDNGQDVITAGAGTETLERVKYGDTNKYDITIVPSEHYSVASVQVNGKEAPYTVNADGSVTLAKIEDIKEDKNISIIYAKNKSQVIVKHYLKDTTDSVFGDEIIIGDEDTAYETEPQSSELYSLATDDNGEYILPSNMTGDFASTPITVIYYYQENEVDLKVNYYLDGTDTELAPSSVQRKVLGSSYQTAPLDIEFYELSRTIGEESGTLTRNLTEVTYMYSQNNEAIITIRHVDKATGNDLVTPITKTVQRHDQYTTDDPVSIPAKYRLTGTPVNASGPAEDANIEVIYYYEEIPFNVSVDKKINSILLNGEKQTITNSKNVTITPAKKDNLIVYYEINLKNTGDIKANFTVVEGDIPGFVIYDKGNFVKTNNGYELVAELEPGEEKTYRIGYKWNQKDYGISTNKVELKEVTNDKGFAEPDAQDNISTATVETKIPKAVLGEPIEIVPNTIDRIPTMIILLITSIIGIMTSLILIRKRRFN